MKKHKAIIFIIFLLVLTGILSAVHLKTRNTVPEGAIEIVSGDEAQIVDITKLDYEEVSGTRVNGKGEEIEVNAPGIYFGTVLEEAGISRYETVAVIADDAYSAEFSFTEIADGIEIYLIQEEGEERLRLVVFGEEDSKRSVSNVAQIIVK